MKKTVYNEIRNIVDTVVIRRDCMVDVNELLEEAMNGTENLVDGELFLVKDLFKNYGWIELL